MILFDEKVQKILDYISERQSFTELELKRKLKIDIATVRKILYTLQEYGIVYPIRMITIKEGKYDYEWGVRIQGALAYEIIASKLLKELELEERELPEILYVCEECNIKLTFEQADEYDMSCPECGSLLDMKENRRLIEIRRLKEEIIKLVESIKSKQAVTTKARARR